MKHGKLHNKIGCEWVEKLCPFCGDQLHICFGKLSCDSCDRHNIQRVEGDRFRFERSNIGPTASKWKRQRSDHRVDEHTMKAFFYSAHPELHDIIGG